MNLLLSGLDTIECAYYLRAGSGCKLDFEALRAQRESLRQNRHSEAAVVNIGSEEFMLSPNGSQSGYPFILTNKDMTVQLGEFNDPSFFVKYSSFALWCKGAQKMHERFLAWAQELGFEVVKPEGLSRVDFAFDFQLMGIDFDEDSFVSLATKDSQHRDNGQLQTISFGRNDVVLRVYNKSAEIEESSGKYWFYMLWDGVEKDVWRVEWQVRKETLKRFGLRTFADLFDGYGDALRYLISEHTSLRVKTEDSNRSRWPIHPLWTKLAEHIQTLPAQGIYREVDPAYMLEETLIRMAISMEGYLKKVAAIECLKEGRSMLSQGQAIERLLPLLAKVHNRLTWNTDVQKRMDQLRLAP